MGFGEGWDLPADAAPWSDFHWFSVPVSGSLRVTVLSEKPVWYTGHFVNDRMIPCVGQGCEYCQKGIGSQIRYCFSVADWESRRVGLIEVGRQNGLYIQDCCVRLGGLRGMVLDFSKQGNKRQSRTVVVFCDRDADPWALGQETPEVGLALYLTWEKVGCKIPHALREQYERKRFLGEVGPGRQSRAAPTAEVEEIQRRLNHFAESEISAPKNGNGKRGRGAATGGTR